MPCTACPPASACVYLSENVLKHARSPSQAMIWFQGMHGSACALMGACKALEGMLAAAHKAALKVTSFRARDQAHQYSPAKMYKKQNLWNAGRQVRGKQRQCGRLRAGGRCVVLGMRRHGGRCSQALLTRPRRNAESPGVAQDGKFAVNSACEAVEGALAARAVHDRVALNHYVTKSRAEYAGKMARGSAMGNQARAPSPAV